MQNKPKYPHFQSENKGLLESKAKPTQKIERSEIPTARRDKPKSSPLFPLWPLCAALWQEMQNKANLNKCLIERIEKQNEPKIGTIALRHKPDPRPGSLKSE
jgi:hypothetical protein